jgi:arylsulfatase A-like enzyme
VSLKSFWAGGPAPTRDVFYWELHEGKGFKQAVRFGHWKAVRNGPAAVELYDLAADPAESTDLAAARPVELKRATELLNSERTDHPDWPMARR